MLSADELQRYERNMRLPGFGEEAQARLAHARVAIIGLGGLGSPAAFYLAAAGVGCLGFMDADSVELSNLNRQIIHQTHGIGAPKVESAAAAIRALNPHVMVETHLERLAEANASALLAPYDAVIEATDNFASKFIINDACVALKKPFATAGILSWSGHALMVRPGATPCLRCVVGGPPKEAPTTAEYGVIGAAAGIIGALQALEILRLLAGYTPAMPDGVGALHSLDGGGPRLKTITVRRRPGCLCASV